MGSMHRLTTPVHSVEAAGGDLSASPRSQPKLEAVAGVLGLLVLAGSLLGAAGRDGNGRSVELPTARAGLTDPAAPSEPMSSTLTILQTNDTWGYLDPCG